MSSTLLMRLLKFCFIFTCAGWLLCSSLLPAGPALGQSSIPVPNGFRLIDSDAGVLLYKKEYKNGNPDYVQVVDLSQGAAVKVLHGEITAERKDRGVYGGPDPRMRSRSLEDYWQEIKSQFRSAFCITNGQFFYMPEYPTRLPFPLKKDGKIVTEGFEDKLYPDQKLMLELWPDRADIRLLTREALHTTTAPDVIAGLSEDANKRAKHNVGRTFMGVADYNADGIFESVLLFNTRSAKQSDAAEVLRNFGAAKVMMLDGGGSTQLMCGKKTYIDSERLIPQAVAVIAASNDHPVQPTPVIAAVEPTAMANAAANAAANAPASAAPSPLALQVEPTPEAPPAIVLVQPTLAPTPLAAQPQLALGRAGAYINQFPGGLASEENQDLLASGRLMLPLIHANTIHPSDILASDPSQEQQATPLVLALEGAPQATLAAPPVPPSSEAELSSPDSSGENLEINLSGSLLIPLSMLPMVGALFIAINKIQRR